MSAETEKLQSQLNELMEKDSRSTVVKRISKQMEDIAYQQKEISDVQREKAVQQTHIATEMKNHAEEERVNAQKAEARAVASYKVAEEQRSFAEVKQQQAEYSKRVADTLSYLALGRSLASLSVMQYNTRNYDVASLMAYSAWMYTSRYQGDVYNSAIFNSLSLNSGGLVTWNQHKGGITRIVPYKNDNDFITISKYGEIIKWEKKGNKTSDKLLYSNPTYDFRDIIIDSDNTVLALSRNGNLIVKPVVGAVKIVPLNGDCFMRIISFSADNFLVISETGLSFYQKKTFKLIRSIPFSQRIYAVGKKNSDYLVFGNKGFTMEITQKGELMALPFTQIKDKITAYVWSSTLQTAAIGTTSGLIYLMNADGKITRRLVGHRSPITQVDFNNNNLFSSSYDCTVKLWNLKEERLEPITIISTSSWIHCFAFLERDAIWIGDEGSVLSRIVISPNVMAQEIKTHLTRNFTLEEWNYFIGANIPLEKFKP